MLNLWLCVLLNVHHMPPIYDPHLPTAEDYQETLDNSDIELQWKREILDLLYPHGAPHTVEDAKDFC